MESSHPERLGEMVDVAALVGFAVAAVVEGLAVEVAGAARAR